LIRHGRPTLKMYNLCQQRSTLILILTRKDGRFGQIERFVRRFEFPSNSYRIYRKEQTRWTRILEDRMEALLNGLIGKLIDVNCGSNVMYSGEVISAGSGLLKIKNEEGHDVFVAIEKIAAVTECSNPGSRPGFIV